MSEFQAILEPAVREFYFTTVSLFAVVLVVTFFLYENKSKRNFLYEIILAIASALALGTSIFFALIKADVVL